MPRVRDHLPKLLVDRGIDVAFGLPSLATLEIYRGLGGSGLRCITVRDPVHVGYVADGYARMSGTPAACIVPYGPGLAAMVPAAAQALADSMPMLILSAAQPDAGDGRRGGFRGTLRDPQGLMDGLCLVNRHVESFEALCEALDEAAAQFARRRPGPVHIALPPALLGAEAPVLTPPPAPIPPPKLPSAALLGEIVMRLAEAQQPVLILGGGALDLGPEVARTLAERLKAPTLLTAGGSGLLPPSHPLHLGGYLASDPVRELLAGADAVLAIGTEFAPEEWGLGPGQRLAFRPGALIRVDIDADRLYQSATPDLPVAADAAVCVEALLASLMETAGGPPDLGPLRQRMAAAMPYPQQRYRPLIDSLWDHLYDSVVFADPCEPASAALACAAPSAPRRWMTGATGFGMPGWALPAAIGAKIAQPRRPVIALMGDVAATGAVAELATAVELNAHVILIVWNNTGLGEMRHAMKQAQIKPAGVDLAGVDLQPIARGVGAAYARVHGAEFFREALRTAIMRPGPTILELREDYWFG